MSNRLAVAIPTCSNRQEDIRLGYALQALSTQDVSGVGFEGLDIFIWDEGKVPAITNPWVSLQLNLLLARGHTSTYLRRGPSQGVGMARRGLLDSIPASHGLILCIDDDLLPMPNSVFTLLREAQQKTEFGFFQGTKIELDARRTYHDDINQLTEKDEGARAQQLWFGDTAFLLLHRTALKFIEWDLVTKYRESGLTGEDVAMTMMIADHLPCYGTARAVGYHMTLQNPRWLWEVPTDLLHLEVLRGKVSPETLTKVFPKFKKYMPKRSK